MAAALACLCPRLSGVVLVFTGTTMSSSLQTALSVASCAFHPSLPAAVPPPLPLAGDPALLTHSSGGKKHSLLVTLGHSDWLSLGHMIP